MTKTDAIEHLARALRAEAQFAGEIRLREPMSRHTTMKVGGAADALIIPADLASLRSVMAAAHRLGVPVMMLGGSNVIVRDNGIAGVVVKLSRLNHIRFLDGGRVSAEAGVLLPRLARAAARMGLSGLEFAVGIPGTVGGSIVMNAGTREGELAPLTESVTLMSTTGELQTLGREALRFRYRHADLPHGCVVAAQFALKAAPTTDIESTMARMLGARSATQPLHYPSAGCVFKNPPGDSAGRLIEAAGLKGCRLGHAQVSDRHANFIVNRGQARAGDVLSLIRHVGRRVEEQFGVTLELEVKIVGRAAPAPPRSEARRKRTKSAGALAS
ncbi:MAG: UDP-N-acetylmuramate dehydrogenase [Nitrospirota bacterium]